MPRKSTKTQETAVKAEPEVKKTAAAETAAKKTAKPAAKKTAGTTTRRKAAAKVVESVYVQYGDSEWDVASLVEKAKAEYVAAGHEAADAKKVTVYVKPEEGKAYYVVNDTDTGSVAL